MKGKVLMALIGLTLTLSMVFGILAGCTTRATPKPTIPGATTKAPTVTAPGATEPPATKPTTTAAATPAKAGEIIKWRCQSGASAGEATYWIQKELVDNIKIASGGRLQIELFPNGAIVNRNECFDAVKAGSIEMAVATSDNDWMGKEPKLQLGNIPAGMEQLVQVIWCTYHSEKDPVSPGEKLFDSIYEKFNLKNILFSCTTPEAEYMANKRILKPADYKGLTFRGAGWELDVIAQPEFGAKPVFIPSADVYSALQTGVVDAIEVTNPYVNASLGYQDITKYWGFPGMHNLSQTTHTLINLDVWKKLPADLQKIVELCHQRSILTTLAHVNVESAKIIPVLADKGIVMVYEDPEVQNFWRKMMFKTADTYAQKDPAFKTELDKCLNFQYMLDAYFDLQHPVYDSTYPGKERVDKGVYLEVGGHREKARV